MRATLGSVLVDALAVRASAGLRPPHQREGRDLRQRKPDRTVARAIIEYVKCRSDPDGVQGRCSLEDLIEMASFYLAVVQLLLKFPRCLLQNLGTAPELGPPTPTERTRFLRGLYRFQLFQNLYSYYEKYSRIDEAVALDEFIAIF